MADETVDYEFYKFLKELFEDKTVKEFLEFDDCVDTCELVVNRMFVDGRQELTLFRMGGWRGQKDPCSL